MRNKVYETVPCPSVGPFVCLSQYWLTTADLQRWAGDIDRLLQQRLAAGECGQCHVVSVRR